MDTGIFTANDRPMIIQQLLPALGPVLLIAIGYVDPGKWAAVVEGGARFGSDLVLLMLVFSFGAILCQYLSASIAVVTGRDLSQVVLPCFLDSIYREDDQYFAFWASMTLNCCAVLYMSVSTNLKWKKSLKRDKSIPDLTV